MHQTMCTANVDSRRGVYPLAIERVFRPDTPPLFPPSLSPNSHVAPPPNILRAANRTTPIVAIAPPQLLKATLPPLARKYFNEILQLPVSAAKVRGLATRWLLQPPSCAGAAATSGMVGEPVDRGPMAWSTEARHAGSSSTSAVGAAGAITTTTTLVSPSLPPGAAPLQQQDGYAPSSGASCGPVSGAEGRTLLASSRCSRGRWKGGRRRLSLLVELQRFSRAKVPLFERILLADLASHSAGRQQAPDIIRSIFRDERRSRIVVTQALARKNQPQCVSSRRPFRVCLVQATKRTAANTN